MASIRQEEIDDLVKEAQRLRDELMRAAAQLEGFASQLTSEAKNLRDAEGIDGGT